MEITRCLKEKTFPLNIVRLNIYHICEQFILYYQNVLNKR